VWDLDETSDVLKNTELWNIFGQFKVISTFSREIRPSTMVVNDQGQQRTISDF
jgi:hypothetical protein